MGDSAMAVIAIFLAAILMFVFPLMTMADKKDDVTSLSVKSETANFATTISTKGKISQDEYDNFVQTLAATGNAYDVDMTIDVLDENPAKKEVSTTSSRGNNAYVTVYTTQILDELKKGDYLLKEGDIVTIKVKNKNQTIAMQLRNFMYKITGNDSATITAEVTRRITTNGN